MPFSTLGEQPNFGSTVVYPTTDSDFPKRLAGLAAMLGAGLPLRCVALNAPGEYDTHANQSDDLASGLKVTAESLLAFQRDLEAQDWLAGWSRSSGRSWPSCSREQVYPELTTGRQERRFSSARVYAGS